MTRWLRELYRFFFQVRNIYVSLETSGLHTCTCMLVDLNVFPVLWRPSKFLLKTLFNIVEAWFKIIEQQCLCYMMMFRWINKQPGIQKLWNWCSHYQDIYDWISPLNKLSDLWFILTQQSMVENEYGKSGNLSFFTYLKHLMMLLKYSFSGLHFYTFSKALIAYRAMQLRFLKWKHC